MRIDLVAKFIKAVRPDMLCLQETKCPDDRFPRKRFKRLGYEHVALNGQKGHHGVVVLSRLPFETSDDPAPFAARPTAAIFRSCSASAPACKDPITLHNFYVPAGGDVPDPAVNPKFAHKLAFLDEMRASDTLRPAPASARDHRRRPQRRAARSRRLEPQAAPRVVSHTPIECEKLIGVQKAGGWIDAVRAFVPEPAKLYTWWSYRAADWRRLRSRPPARPHLDVAMRWPTASPPSRSPGTIAAPSGRPTTCR